MSAEPGSGWKVQMSSWQGTAGQCFASTRWQNGSLSTNATVSIPPSQRAASEKPPIPLKVSIIRSFATVDQPSRASVPSRVAGSSATD
jgi:hypothetical protein